MAMPIQKSTRRISSLVCSFVVMMAGGCLVRVWASPGRRASYRTSSDAAEIERLFRDDIQQAAVRLKWRGEPLNADTAYALALTGASWEPAWGKIHLFSMAWGDSRKLVGPERAGARSESVDAVTAAFAEHRYSDVTALADRNLSASRIACDPALKEPVGRSLLALGHPDQAFDVFASPFDPGRSREQAVEENLRFRWGAFEAARRSGRLRESIAFAASLLLEPGGQRPEVNRECLAYLEGVGVDLDRLLIGVLQAPEHLGGLSGYYYASASLLVYRASPRLIPLFFHLCRSEDVYLRSRAVIALGLLAYEPDARDWPGWERRVLPVPVRRYGLSTGAREMISREINAAAASDRYRLRVAAAIAASLAGGEDSLNLLRKLALDRAYILSAPRAGGSRARQIVFPVRVAANAGLARYSRDAETGNGEFSGRALQQARRGGEDVTNDRRDLRNDVASQVFVSPLDADMAIPVEASMR